MKTVFISSLLALGFQQSAAKSMRHLQQLQYDEDEAILAHGYCSISSCNNEQLVLDWSCIACNSGNGPIPAPNRLSDISIIEDDEEIAHAVLGYDAIKDRVVVAFQGTTNDAQADNNLNTGNTGYQGPDGNCNGCLATRAFYLPWLRIDNEVAARVNELATQYNTNDVFVVGYSLGGALATHGILRLSFESANGRPYNLVGYSFGQPRLSNQEFMDYFRDNVPNFFRIINYEDPVPALLSGADYQHVPQEIWYIDPPSVGSSPGRFIVLDDVNGEDPDGQVSECLNSNFFRLCLDFNDHYTYLNAPTVSDEDRVCG